MKPAMPAPRPALHPCQTLAPQERKIVVLLALPDKIIADKLGLKASSVTSRLPMIFKKLQAKGRTDAALKWQAWATRDITLTIP